MNTQLKALLERKIQEWADENCKSAEWPDGWTGENTVFLMAEAASAVFDAVMEAQEHAIREGMLAET